MRLIAQTTSLKPQCGPTLKIHTHTSLYMHTVRRQWECAIKPIADTMLSIACGPHGDVHVTPEMDPYCKPPNAVYECDHVANPQIHYDYGE